MFPNTASIADEPLYPDSFRDANNISNGSRGSEESALNHCDGQVPDRLQKMVKGISGHSRMTEE